MGLNVIDPNFRSPYAENFNLTIERELPGQHHSLRRLCGISCSSPDRRDGSESHHQSGQLPGRSRLAPAIPTTQWFSTRTADTASPTAPNSGGQRELVPLVASAEQSSFGNSNYNSLQVTANKQMSHGLTFLAAYTYSHSLDIGSSFEGSGFGGLSGPGLSPFNTIELRGLGVRCPAPNGDELHL